MTTHDMNLEERVYEDGNVVAEPSPIHGTGLFAKRDFKKGEVVVMWNPLKHLPKEEIPTLSDEDKHALSELPDGTYIVNGAPARYVNHSCDANTTAEGMKDVAVREIKAGEEITANYGSEGGLEFSCACGTTNCKSK